MKSNLTQFDISQYLDNDEVIREYISVLIPLN